MEEVVHIRLEAFGKARFVGPSKFKWDHVRDKVQEARRRSLKIAGMEIRRSAQRSMANPKPKQPKLIDLGVVNGERLIAKRTQTPKPDRVSSWKTSRFPKGFLRSDIQYDYDAASDTVVVGPAKLPKLNKLHEVGGSVQLWFVRTSPPAKVPRKFSGGAVFGIQSNRPSGEDSIRLGTRRVKSRKFMAQGLDKARGKIPDAFRDSLIGP